MEAKSAMVLLSGGQDSATCLAMACRDCEVVEAICFDYGQRHHIEIEMARALAKRASVSFTVIDLSLLSQLTVNALTCSDIVIENVEGVLPNTFVPGRNQLFLTVAAIAAYQKEIRLLYTGVCQTDYSGYPDCRESFIKSMTQSLNLAMDSHFEIRTPLMHLSKAETVLLMKDLGQLDWYKDTHTCYEGQRPACGQCPSCVLRLKGFSESGIEDPLRYVNGSVATC